MSLASEPGDGLLGPASGHPHCGHTKMSDSRLMAPMPLPLRVPAVTVIAAGFSIAAIVLALEAPSGSDPMVTDPTTLRCTNPFSGATWDVPIDPIKRTAASFPADITDNSIQWQDSVRGGRYAFDRASGELTVIYASSMGGTFLKDKCQFAKPRRAR
jgi:hypothetical protein